MNLAVWAVHCRCVTTRLLGVRFSIELRHFTTISSDIYRQLYSHYELVYDDWVAEWEEEFKSEDEDEDEVETDGTPQTKPLTLARPSGRSNAIRAVRYLTLRPA